MTGQTTIFVGVLVVAASLFGCSADDGKPSIGSSATTVNDSGAGEGLGAGGGQSVDGGLSPRADGGPSPDAGETTNSGTMTGTKKAAAEVCKMDADCASGVCYVGEQGSYCSLKCTADTGTTVCVAPFVGTCNKKGFCKK